MDPGFNILYPNYTVYDVRTTYNWRKVPETFSTPVIRRAGFHKKSASIRSNHSSPTAFSREVVEVLSDVPAVTQEPLAFGPQTRSTHLYNSGSAGPLDVSLPGFDPLVANARARSITKARERLRDDNSFDTGVAIAEAKATAEMLGDRGYTMASAIRNFRRFADSLPRGARERVLLFAGAWLEGYYGWGSLARDAFALDAKLRSQVREPLLISASAKTTVRHSVPFRHDGSIYGKEYEGEAIVKAKYTARLDDQFARRLDGWGLINPAAILWERVPYSFVIDWFIPIGNTLSSLTATAGLTFVDGYVSEVRRTRMLASAKPNPSSYWKPRILDPGQYTVQRMAFKRDLAIAFEMPQLYANTNPFSTPRITSAVALITQAILGR